MLELLERYGDGQILKKQKPTRLFYNDFAAFCTKHFGARPCDLTIDWHSIGATLRLRNLLGHIDIALWVVSHGAQGLPDNLVLVETWQYYPLQSAAHSAESLRDFVKKQLAQGIAQEELEALKDLFLTQVSTFRSMQDEVIKKMTSFCVNTSLAHGFTHLAFDGHKLPADSTPASENPSDGAAILPVPTYPGTAYRLRK